MRLIGISILFFVSFFDSSLSLSLRLKFVRILLLNIVVSECKFLGIILRLSIGTSNL